MDFFSILWIASLALFIAGPTVAGMVYRKQKMSFTHALIAGLLALTISAALSWSVVVFM